MSAELRDQAQPEPAGLSDEELLSLDQLRDAWNAQADAANSWDELGIDEIIWWAQHQALATWGRPAPQPANGEVAGLVGELRRICFDVAPCDADTITRAADLLERLSPPQPVPVSERLPGPEDCDAEGRCWWGDAGGGGFVPSWRLCEQPDATHFTHWRPAHALPLPGEVDHG